MNQDLNETAPASEPAPRSAFGAHGLMAPGVVWMRNVGFGVKSTVITLLFMSAIGLLAYAYYGVQLGNIAFSAKERVGVAYLRASYPVLQATLDVRRAATTAGASTDRSTAALQAALDGLKSAQDTIGGELMTSDAHQKALESLKAAQTFQGAQLPMFAAYTQAAKSVIGLMLQATDSSNLTLDPDVDSYYVMDSVAFRLPDMMERTTLLRDGSFNALTNGAINNQVRDEMIRSAAIVVFHLENLEGGLNKTLAIRPDLATQFDLPKAQRAVQAFLEFSKTRVIDSDTFDASKDELQRLADQALAEQLRLSGVLLNVLDDMLAERIGGMQTGMWVKTVFIMTVIALALYFFYSFYLVTRGGLRLISSHLIEMAQGDLRRAPAQPWGQDEPALVISDLRKVYDALHELIRQVRHSARELTATSVEIAQAATDLSARTESNAASLEQQASAMEEIGSQVADSAQRAQSAADFAQRNAQVASSSREVVNTVVHTMRDIQQSSAKIGDIIGVIDGIAFQTNILALNAAVEAARAGEAGRGFAVVASEVRSLAQRSAEAAKEIKGLITTSVNKVESGVDVVESAGASIGELVNNAEQINQYVTEISLAAREQAAGVEQAGQAIQQLDASTQQNASLVEETSAAATALKEQAALLQGEIAKFRVR